MGAVGHSKNKIEVFLLYPLKQVFRTMSTPHCLDPFWVRMPGQESSSELAWKKGKENREEGEGKTELDTFLVFSCIISSAWSKFRNIEN